MLLAPGAETCPLDTGGGSEVREVLKALEATGLPPSQAGPKDPEEVNLGRQERRPWAAVTSAGQHVYPGQPLPGVPGMCTLQTAALSKPSPVHFSKARSSWFFPSGRRRDREGRWAERSKQKMPAEPSLPPGPRALPRFVVKLWVQTARFRKL